MRPKPIPEFSWEELDQIREEVLGEEEDIGGGFTVPEYIEQYKVSERTALRQLNALVKSGRLNRRKVRRVIKGTARRVNCYWPVGMGKGKK